MLGLKVHFKLLFFLQLGRKFLELFQILIFINSNFVVQYVIVV